MGGIEGVTGMEGPSPSYDDATGATGSDSDAQTPAPSETGSGIDASTGMAAPAPSSSAFIVTCNAGEYETSIAGNNLECSLCAAGSITNTGTNPGAISCTPCIAGFYSSSSTVDSCSACSAGYFSALEQQASCDSCPFGQWQDLEGQSTCKNCFAGKISKRTKQTSNGTCENCGTCACINCI